VNFASEQEESKLKVFVHTLISSLLYLKAYCKLGLMGLGE